MQTIYATDLDRTLIYSNKFRRTTTSALNLQCVEWDAYGIPLSYMTKDSSVIFNRLKKKMLVIPVTTRSLDQFNRVSVTRDCPIAITSNGGIILRNGKRDTTWDTHVANQLKDYDFTKIQSLFPKARLVDNIFYYFKAAIPYDHTRTLSKLPTDWTAVQQGNKVYIIPSCITKEAALAYILENTLSYFLFTSGDGPLDQGFLEMGHVSIIPKDSYLATTKHLPNTLQIDGGLDGVTSMLSFIEKRG